MRDGNGDDDDDGPVVIKKIMSKKCCGAITRGIVRSFKYIFIYVEIKRDRED